MRELSFFEDPEVKKLVERAEALTQAGIESMPGSFKADLKAAKEMPRTTAEEKEIRHMWLDAAHSEKTATKVIARYFPEGITEFDEDVFQKLFDQEDKADEELKKASAQNDKNAAAQLRQRKRLIAAEIKKAQKQYSIYNRASRPYNEAQKLLQRKDSINKIDELRKLYAHKALS